MHQESESPKSRCAPSGDPVWQYHLWEKRWAKSFKTCGTASSTLTLFCPWGFHHLGHKLASKCHSNQFKSLESLQKGLWKCNHKWLKSLNQKALRCHLWSISYGWNYLPQVRSESLQTVHVSDKSFRAHACRSNELVLVCRGLIWHYQPTQY